MHPERVPVSFERRHESRKRRKSVEDEEVRAWVGFYRHVGDAQVATEVLALLDTDAEVRRDHPALVLLCRQSLRRHKIGQQRRRRLAHAVQMLFEHLVIAPAFALRRVAIAGADVLVECLQPSKGGGPDHRAAPVLRKARRADDAPTFARTA
jgi:hypothetical protein